MYLHVRCTSVIRVCPIDIGPPSRYAVDRLAELIDSRQFIVHLPQTDVSYTADSIISTLVRSTVSRIFSCFQRGIT